MNTLNTLNKIKSKCLTMCPNCKWDYESRKEYSIMCKNCCRTYCDNCYDCGTKCKKNNKNILLTPDDPELNVVCKNGYGYNTKFDFAECILCTKVKENMKIRVKDKYELLLKKCNLTDSEVDELVKFHRNRDENNNENFIE